MQSYRCDPAVKALLSNHARCNKVKIPSQLTGAQINKFLCSHKINNASLLDKDRNYTVCSNALSMMKSTMATQQTTTSQPTTPQDLSLPPICRCSPHLNTQYLSLPPICRRSPRLNVCNPPRSVVARPPSSSTPRRLNVHSHHTRTQPNPYLKISKLKAVSIRIGDKK